MCEYCRICGARISDNNTTGIGYECLAAMNAAKRYKAKKDGLALKSHIFKADKVRALYLECSENVNFRSQFRKDFRNSMVNAERISLKQLEIMEQFVIEKGLDDKLRQIDKNCDEYVDRIIDGTEVTIEEINSARKFIRSK